MVRPLLESAVTRPALDWAMPRRKSRGTQLLIGIDTGIHIGCADAYPQVTDADVIIFGSKEFSQSRGPPIGRQSA